MVLDSFNCALDSNSSNSSNSGCVEESTLSSAAQRKRVCVLNFQACQAIYSGFLSTPQGYAGSLKDITASFVLPITFCIVCPINLLAFALTNSLDDLASVPRKLLEHRLLLFPVIKLQTLIHPSSQPGLLAHPSLWCTSLCAQHTCLLQICRYSTDQNPLDYAY